MKNNEENLDNLRHSCAHLLAAAIMKLWPNTKRAIGPSIEDGFYFDFEFEEPISEKNFPKIEKTMREILKHWKGFERHELSKEEALKEYSDNPYKSELIEEFSAKGEKLSFYKSGDYSDLCRGGHVEDPKKELQHFKLLSIAGAYWRGSEKNKMLTRIYGTAFSSKEDLQKYLLMLEEAKKRDHRKLGKELDLFTFSELVGAGLPLWTPKGTTLRNELQNRLWEVSKKYDMQPVTIPHIGKRKLYETSGHAQKFGAELLQVKSHFDEFVMKPVNCPHHTQIYASRPRSYRDLPIRYMESTMQYRDEQPGEISGLTRVRSITVDDGHIFCTPDQIKEEAINIAKIIEEFYSSLGLFGNHWVSLSVRNPNTPDAYLGEPSDWNKAEKMLQEVSDDLKLGAKRKEGEAAIYGPKLDYMFKDSMGREWQLGTIQIDFAMPQRFGLEYTNKNGEKSTPVMIHRAILGSYERFLAILIEHFAGAFPVWLSPVQVKVLPITDKQNKYAQQVVDELKENNIRVELDDRSESVGKKIREAEMEKVPYMLIVGEKEVATKSVAVRGRNQKDLGAMKIDKFSKKILEEIKARAQS